MNKLIFVTFLLCGGQLLFGDSVACGLNGFPPGTGQPVGQAIPCSQAPVINIMANFPKLVISGNTLTLSPQASIGVNQMTITSQFTGTVSYDDVFALPSSPAGDVLKFSAAYGAGVNDVDPGSYASFQAQIGPGSAGFPAITLNPAHESCEFGSCFYSATLPASDFSFITLQGTAGLLVSPDDESSEGGVGSGGNFTFTRFKADGVTPDPFTTTPEPASFALALAGILLFGVVRLFGNARRRTNVL